jgi:hypothetical protein
MAKIIGKAKSNLPQKHPLSFFITKIEADNSLGKRMSLTNDGELYKEILPPAYKGKFETLQFSSLQDFNKFLSSVDNNMAVTYGLFKGENSGKFVSKSLKEGEYRYVRKMKTRTREAMEWGNSSGILFLDYDPPVSSKAMTKEELISAIRETCPFLNEVEMLWRPSSSSLIENANTGETISEIAGQHLYIIAEKASEIPELGQEIAKRLWLNGYGRFDISKAGIALKKTIVDTTVWQPERLDFVGGAEVSSPLSQKKLVGKIIKGKKRCISLNDIAQLDAHEIRTLDHLMREKRKEVEFTCYIKRDEFKKQMLKRTLGEDFNEENSEHFKRRAHLLAALMDGVLYEDFILRTRNGTEVSVGEILDQPDKYNRKRFADPLEPDYRNDNRIAWARLNVVHPFIYSFAHGGRRFLLKRKLPEIELIPGEFPRAIDQIIEVLLTEGNFFKDKSGTLLQRVFENNVHNVDENWLADKISRLVILKKFNKTSKTLVPADISDKIPKAILAKVKDTNFPELNAVALNPIINLDGTYVEDIGFDPSTGIYISSKKRWGKIPKAPTDNEVKQAFEDLWKPFKEFPFASNLDKSIFFAGILTSILRPVLPTAPGFAIDAPVQGSGKTLLARCLGILINEQEPDISAPFDGEKDVRNKILSYLLKRKRIVIIDNMFETLDSPSLASFFTSREFSERQLHTSKDVSLTTRSFWVFTGNNIKFAGDLNRRILTVRIDPKMENEDVLKRSFSLEPSSFLRKNRKKLIMAALTILSGYYSSGAPNLGHGKTPSFEEWSDSIRQCVLWLNHKGITKLEDPNLGFVIQMGSDENHRILSVIYDLWQKLFNRRELQVSDIVNHLTNDQSAEAIQLKELFVTVSSETQDQINRRKLGKWLSSNRDKRIDGRMLVLTDRKTNNVNHFKVVNI